jgi:hypothetical protein
VHFDSQKAGASGGIVYFAASLPYKEIIHVRKPGKTKNGKITLKRRVLGTYLPKDLKRVAI